MEAANLGCCSVTVKYLVCIFNFIFFLCGLGLVIIGAIVQGFFAEYVQFFANKYETPAIGIIILGGIIMIIAFFGCCGARKENVCMLNMFAGLLGLVVVCEGAACITVAVLRNEVQSAAEENMRETMEQYGRQNYSLVTSTWDDMQQKYACCGVKSYTDWFNVSTGIASPAMVPDSCCITYTLTCAKDINRNTSQPSTVIHTDGCFDSLQQSALNNLAAITAGVVVLALIQAVGIWMACGLVKALRERYEVL